MLRSGDRVLYMPPDNEHCPVIVVDVWDTICIVQNFDGDKLPVFTGHLFHIHNNKWYELLHKYGIILN